MPRIHDTHLARVTAALASAGAGAIHVAVVPTHLREWWAAGVFFVALAAFQFGWALALVRWQQGELLGFGALVNVAAVILWIETRTLGLPVGPNAGIAKEIGLAGVLTVVLELVACAGVLWCLRPGRTWALSSLTGSVTAVAAAVAVPVGLAVPGALAGVSHGHGQHGHAAATPTSTATDTHPNPSSLLENTAPVAPVAPQRLSRVTAEELVTRRRAGTSTRTVRPTTTTGTARSISARAQLVAPASAGRRTGPATA